MVDAPFEQTVANAPGDTAPHQSWCPRPAIPPDADRCLRCGVLQPANTAAMTHGLRSTRAQEALLPGQEELRAVLAEQRHALLTDLGGDSNVSVVLRDTVDRYLRLGVLASTLEARIEREGMLTAKGRTRASVTLYLSVVDRLMKLSQQLGFDRRTKPVDPLDAVRAAVADANRNE